MNQKATQTKGAKVSSDPSIRVSGAEAILKCLLAENV